MSLTDSHCCWLSLTVSMELLHVYNSFPWWLLVSHCLFGPMELLHVSLCCSLSLPASPVPLSYCMSRNVSYGCLLSLIFATSAMELLHVSCCLL